MAHAGDVREGPELERAGMALLLQQFARLDAMMADDALNNIVVAPESRMHADDLATEYDPLSNQVVYLVATAEDHLRTLKDFVELTDGGIPAFALYSVIRGALEAGAWGIWLLSGGTRDKRALRSFRFVLSNRADVEPLARQLGVANDPGKARMRRRIEELKAARPGLNQYSLDTPVSTTDIVTEADRHVKKGEFTGVQAWRICSGMAHGNRATAMVVSERRKVADGGAGSPLWEFTASVIVLAWMYQIAVDYLEEVLRLYAQHSRPSAQDSHQSHKSG